MKKCDMCGDNYLTLQELRYPEGEVHVCLPCIEYAVEVAMSMKWGKP